MDNFTKTDDSKNLCPIAARTKYSWVYKGMIPYDPIKKVKVKLVLQIPFILYCVQLFQAHILRMNI
jgi:hypothetical protein